MVIFLLQSLLQQVWFHPIHSYDNIVIFGVEQMVSFLHKSLLHQALPEPTSGPSLSSPMTTCHIWSRTNGKFFLPQSLLQQAWFHPIHSFDNVVIFGVEQMVSFFFTSIIITASLVQPYPVIFGVEKC
jgi:hypothetical protein